MQTADTVAEFVRANANRPSEETAPTYSAPFDSVADLLANAPAPKRPNRTAPLKPSGDDVEAWEAMSDDLSGRCGWE